MPGAADALAAAPCSPGGPIADATGQDHIHVGIDPFIDLPAYGLGGEIELVGPARAQLGSV
jgi:hypothetical protein